MSALLSTVAVTALAATTLAVLALPGRLTSVDDVTVALGDGHLPDEVPLAALRDLRAGTVRVGHDDVAGPVADEKNLAADLALPNDVLAGLKRSHVELQRVGEVVKPQTGLAQVADEQSRLLVNQVWFRASAAVSRVSGLTSRRPRRQILHLVGDVIPLGLRGVHLAGADEPEEGLLIVVREREGTDEEGVQDHAHAPHVHRGGVRLAQENLGSDVGRGAALRLENLPRGFRVPRQTKVGDDHGGYVVRPGEQEVLELEVPVRDIVEVHVREGVQELSSDHLGVLLLFAATKYIRVGASRVSFWIWFWIWRPVDVCGGMLGFVRG